MIQVDRSLFSNVMAAVQRTSNLPGGGVSGLPGGVVVRGLEGVSSFGSDIQDAQKEYELGRVRTALERVRQLDSLFQGIAGRWNSTVNNVLSSARTGKQQISIQKLNEVKQAQVKMQQLTRPASKSFQDLIAALEIAITNKGRTEHDAQDDSPESQTQNESDQEELAQERDVTTQASKSDDINEVAEPELPDTDLLGRFSMNYGFGDQLKIEKGKDGKPRIDPKFEPNKFYFFQGLDPPRVYRVREIQKGILIVFDTHFSQETSLNGREIKSLLAEGVWRLDAKKTRGVV